ncbi:SNF2 family N-terminal domain [Nesidiocoris tenuis]|uniref:SNF2 family N-terminal domain n=1 Tax=Nesidiocoris tenuis TaxID=355587 RepID=A0ABN7ARQ5_9HEMI|nr:SNF2 family N-terminal domain [Nesidiocoris tenuis]
MVSWTVAKTAAVTLPDIPENENSCNSADSGLGIEIPPENVVVTPEMLEEEERLRKINEEKEMERVEIRRAKKEEKMKLDKEMREQSKKGLMTVLNKSKFYADYMKKQIKQAKRPGKQSRKRKHQVYTEVVSEMQKEKKRKKDLQEDGRSDEQDPTTTDSQEATTKMTKLGLVVNSEQPDLLEGACLRDYQMEGFRWMKSLYEGGVGGILADEMGLGKTVQTIAFLSHLYEKGVNGPFLVVAPLSTLPNWMNEFEAFAPQIPVILYHGPHDIRRRNLAPKLTTKFDLSGQKVAPVIVTSYEVPRYDLTILSQLVWKCIVVDEGHSIKNHNSQLARCLASLKSFNRLLLTGTPLQNNLTELWSLLHFLLPEIFDSLEYFETLFTVEEIQNGDLESCLEKESQSSILSTLQQVLEPFVLRRVKADVDLKIPPKKEILVHCPMTKTQLNLYTAILDKSILLSSQKNKPFITEGPNGEKLKRFSKMRDASICVPVNNEEDWEVKCYASEDFQYTLNVKMTIPQIALIKVLNHPYLIHPKVWPGSRIMRIDEEILHSSGKLSILDGLLTRLKARGHRVLLFSTYTSLLNIIEEYADHVGHTYRRLDGNTKIDIRRQYIKEFNTDPSIFMFLLSTRAGGLGINLTGADTVVIYNSDWNPQADLQAQDRCHRIGQTKPVVVYRLMTVGTVDEKIVHRAASKRKLEKMIIQNGRFKHDSGAEPQNMSLEELRELLKGKQHSLEIQGNGTMFTDEQWEILLDRTDLQLPAADAGPSSSRD